MQFSDKSIEGVIKSLEYVSLGGGPMARWMKICACNLSRIFQPKNMEASACEFSKCVQKNEFPDVTLIIEL